jgi:hypothetical protein
LGTVQQSFPKRIGAFSSRSCFNPPSLSLAPTNSVPFFHLDILIPVQFSCIKTSESTTNMNCPSDPTLADMVICHYCLRPINLCPPFYLLSILPLLNPTAEFPPAELRTLSCTHTAQQRIKQDPPKNLQHNTGKVIKTQPLSPLLDNKKRI